MPNYGIGGTSSLIDNILLYQYNATMSTTCYPPAEEVMDRYVSFTLSETQELNVDRY